ncbi:endonuclease domain-containing protein [Hymenobacter latericus]|uniref:endonuclease domain-containing protein n=1 Tax=Hymenobacter sp. YIM 151858-1 TaxID=2987688 RepID=UPI002225C321|nr:endonuclease domain-containing protein [Hymenobacter sp. YIM 151858-1]UYZ60945.1 endonuclease domain-containing protein [Hymenobacter sp. YIM 151858-1]
MQYNLSSVSAWQMRRQPTLAEAVMWQHLRGKRLGFRFRRQNVIDRFIADFICIPAKLIVEVDGGYHNQPEQNTYDEGRTHNLATLGDTVSRFSNEEVLHQPDSVVAQIRQHLA